MQILRPCFPAAGFNGIRPEKGHGRGSSTKSAADRCISWISASGAPPTCLRDNVKERQDKFDFMSRTEISDVITPPETPSLGLRTNLRHIVQTGGHRLDFHEARVGPRRKENTENSGGTSDLGCKHFSICSGCLLERALDKPPVLQDAAIFFKHHGIDELPLISSSVWEWRCRAKLAVRGTSKNPMIGLFEEGSHVIVDIPHCRAHHPRINAAVELVKEAISRLGVEPYDDETGLGHLRYVQMVVSTYDTSRPAAERYANGKVQVTLVWNARDETGVEAKFLQPMAEFLWRKGGVRSQNPILHSIWGNFQTSRTNQVIFGGKWRYLLGQQHMWERISGADICFSPASFGQANLQAFGALVSKLQTHVKRGSAVVELYAGVGIIGITLATTRACRSVKCVEINKDSKESFKRSVSRLADSVSGTISWHCADASVTPIMWLEGSDTVIVDPPRKGLDPPVIEALRMASLRGEGKLRSPSYTRSRVEKRPWVIRASKGVSNQGSSSLDNETGVSWPNTLIYVSCGWQSFKKDCAALLAGDAWHLDGGYAFNFFPGTDSIEVLAVFKRGKSRKKVKIMQITPKKHWRKSLSS